VERVFPRGLRTAIEVILVGGVLGFVVSAGLMTVATDQGWFASTGENPSARNYMVALLQREADRLTQLQPQQDVMAQALAEKNAQARAQAAKPVSLTYLGGASQGRLSVQIYAVEVRAQDGTQQLFPLALTLFGGRVIDRK
jgi:hypothetical protein